MGICANTFRSYSEIKILIGKTLRRNEGETVRKEGEKERKGEASVMTSRSDAVWANGAGKGEVERLSVMSLTTLYTWWGHTKRGYERWKEEGGRFRNKRRGGTQALLFLAASNTVLTLCTVA